MTANDVARTLRDDLKDRGFTLETADGRLWVHPADRLTDDDRAAIRACRDALYAMVAGLDDGADGLDDDTGDRAAERDQRAEQGDDDDPATWPAIPCDWRGWREGCTGEAVRDGRHLCPACLIAWEAGERGPRTASTTAAAIGLNREVAA